MMPLEARLLARLADSGPVPFAAYMEAVLYEADGYYARRVPGPGSDYRTSPSLTPWFGRLLAGHFRRQWEALESETFTVVEVGGGSGDLAAAALECIPVRWRFVERFDAVRDLQRRRLPASAPVEWVEALGTDPVDGCVLANEVIDNMPVHVFERTADACREVYVAAVDGRLTETLGPPSSDEAAALAARALPHLEEGDRWEVRPGVEPWCAAAAATLRRGSLLVLDYGDVEPDLWVRRPAGSLVTYRDDRMGDDPLEAPGLADVTAHVDFSHLERSALAAGFTSPALRTQREFLLSLGLQDVVDRLRGEPGMAAMAERSRVGALAARGSLGDLLVFSACTRR
jgi:SAM-dependent MidA family methyltransferase